MPASAHTLGVPSQVGLVLWRLIAGGLYGLALRLIPHDLQSALLTLIAAWLCLLGTHVALLHRTGLRPEGGLSAATAGALVLGACLGGERAVGKAGRSSENKVPFVVAMQTTDDGRAHLACLSARPFTNEAMKQFTASSMDLPLTVVSDDLGCFTVAASLGAVHERVVADACRRTEAARARNQGCRGSSLIGCRIDCVLSRLLDLWPEAHILMVATRLFRFGALVCALADRG